MQATIKTTSGQQDRYVALIMQETPSGFKVALEEEHSNDGCGHDFRIAQLALDIFGMIKGFQQVVTQTTNGYNLILYAIS